MPGPPGSDPSLPAAMAIAGGWGYIGSRFVRAALGLGIQVYVHDPAPRPNDLDGAEGVVHVPDPDRFYSLPAPFYHLALQPAHRPDAERRLARRAARGEALLALVEKPLAAPDGAAHAREILSRPEGLPWTLLYDFTELFRPMTRTVLEHLRGFGSCRIESISMTRAKDRENPVEPRNHIPTLPIQYQETAHCIAWVLSCLDAAGNTAASGAPAGVHGESGPYRPPNPERYPEPVDGYFRGGFRFGETEVRFHSDYRAGTEKSQHRRIEGYGDGRPFVIEADYKRGGAFLRINGEELPTDAEDRAHGEAIRAAWAFHRAGGKGLFNGGPAPGAAFAHRVWALSGMLHAACHSAEHGILDGRGMEKA